MIKITKEITFSIPGSEPAGVTKVYVFGILIYVKVVK